MITLIPTIATSPHESFRIIEEDVVMGEMMGDEKGERICSYHALRPSPCGIHVIGI
jgi:hypothetical protein